MKRLSLTRTPSFPFLILQTGSSITLLMSCSTNNLLLSLVSVSPSFLRLGDELRGQCCRSGAVERGCNDTRELKLEMKPHFCLSFRMSLGLTGEGSRLL